MKMAMDARMFTEEFLEKMDPAIVVAEILKLRDSSAERLSEVSADKIVGKGDFFIQFRGQVGEVS